MNRKVICALRLYDDFTGMLLKGKEYHFKMNGQVLLPITKKDGYFVFTGEKSEILELIIESPDYITYKQRIDTSLFSNNLPIIDCRLLPNENYAKHIDKKITGKVSYPNTELILIPQTEKPILKYGGKIEDKSCGIIINTSTLVSFMNLNFTISSSLEQWIEVFQINERLKYNQFVMSQALQEEYKVGLEIIRIYRAISQEDGSFVILLDDFYDTDRYVLIHKEKEILRKQTITS